MNAAATAPTTGAAAPSLSLAGVGASVVAVLQVVDERELDLVPGLQDEARAAEGAVVHARLERRVRRLENDHVDGQRRREETARRLDLVVREGVERTADAGRVPGRDLGVRAEQRADQDCK